MYGELSTQLEDVGITPALMKMLQGMDVDDLMQRIAMICQKNPEEIPEEYKTISGTGFRLTLYST